MKEMDYIQFRNLIEMNNAFQLNTPNNKWFKEMNFKQDNDSNGFFGTIQTKFSDSYPHLQQNTGEITKQTEEECFQITKNIMKSIQLSIQLTRKKYESNTEIENEKDKRVEFDQFLEYLNQPTNVIY